ncbi:MAG: GGDEF domain-containing protein [Streptosporangiaceae bacterium]|nr:GGDEF domain-containing protein [Streptosporangiaceae bacterium]
MTQEAAIRAWQWPAARWAVWQLTRRLRLLVTAVIACYAAVLAAAAASLHLRPGDLTAYATLLGFGIITVELTRRSGEPAGLVKDLHAVWYLPAAIVLPPLYGLAAPVPVLVLSQLRVRRALMHRRVFTAAAIGLSLAAASLAFHAAVGPFAASLSGPASPQLRWAFLVACCAALRTMINKFLVVAAIKGSEPAASVRQLAWGREVLYNDVTELCLSVIVAFAVAHVALMITFALPFVILLQRSFRHAQLVDQARIDGKTGLLNAAAWQREAHTEVTRAARAGAPLCLAMIDIDHFKQVNDTYGHLAGDAALAALAAATRALLRDYDIVGRFGGEEFAVLLPDTAITDAGTVTERLRAKLSQITFLARTASGIQLPLQVTVSIGVAALSTSRRDLDELIAAADLALYRAKADGRNLVRLADDASAPAS